MEEQLAVNTVLHAFCSNDMNELCSSSDNVTMLQEQADVEVVNWHRPQREQLRMYFPNNTACRPG